jgi:hypothetical protein
MRNPISMPPLALMTLLAFSSVLNAQQAGARQGQQAASTAANPAPAAAQSQNNSTKIPDLSGTWGRGQGGFGSSLSLSDPTMKNRGHEDDIPYQDWARAKTLSERTSTGPEAQFYNSTNPQMWCEPVGAPAVYGWPAKTKFAQTDDTVYILYEYGVRFRIVRLNSQHPPDPDPQWWGDSIGWYENGDTLVVDTVGLNDKVWLDEAGHPQTEKMHMIERYKRVDKDTIRLDLTLDDPGAYTKTWSTFRNFKRSDERFLKYQWECTVREVQGFTQTLGKPALAPGTPASLVDQPSTLPAPK